jgi:hypothetical protein
MSMSLIKNLPIGRVILPITLISSSVILRRNKKLNKKHRRMIRILQISILIIFISQNLPFFRALVEMFIYYTNPSTYKDHFDFELPNLYKYREKYIEEIENIYSKVYSFLMRGGSHSHRLFKKTIRGSLILVKWLIQSGNF